MNNFEYYAPTKVIFGKDRENEIGSILKDLNYKNILVHFGGESAKKSGLLDRVCNSLKKENISFQLLGGVVPNPRLSKVYEGIELCKQNNIDFILAVGGGSVIDSSKAIAYGSVIDEDVWDIYLQKIVPTKSLPIGCILTISAAGSEMSNSSVITNEEGSLKRGYNNEISRPLFAILNPDLCATLPMYQTQSGIVDIIMHTLERYFSPKRENTELTDYIAEGLMKTVIKNAYIVLKAPSNYNALAEVMWAGSLSHNGLTAAGSGSVTGDWACHQMEHELSGMFDVAHGAGLSALWGTWANYVYRDNPKRFAQFAQNVMNIPFTTETETAEKGIEALVQFFKDIGMPTKISDFGIDLTEEQIEELAMKCSFNETRTVGNFRVLQKEDMATIYRLAR